MSFPNNNSRNIANLLRFQPLIPIRQPNQPRINQNNQLPSRQRIQIPALQVFTPEQIQTIQKRNSRRIAPLSSGGSNRNQEVLMMSKSNNYEFQKLRTRLDQIIKFYDERHSNLESKMMVRLNQLQNFVMKQVPKIDNNIMISSDIIGFKQALKQVRRQQQLQFNQINTLKAMNRERGNSEALLSQNGKDKQKMTVLFMQLKVTDQMNGSTRTYESRIQDLQLKLMNSQKNLSIISQRTSSGSDVLNQFGDKLMNRLQSAQSNLLVLGKQQIKHRQVMNTISSQNQRIGEDINTMIMNMQTDFQNKLQNRMSETMNRLMRQHQERIRAQQQIRKNLDMMGRVNQEKQQTDSLQHKARLNDMDAAVRNQFLRKQQSIRGLQGIMQQSFKNVMGEIQGQGQKRKEQQQQFRFQIKKVQQSYRKQNDMYKNHQSQLIDKMTDLIKSQIQSRTLQENDLKRITGQVGKMIADDLNNLKEAVSISNKKLNMAVKQVSSESSERSGQLSHYVDLQVKKVVDVVTEKYSKMKNVFTKLAQQFKSHLQNTETNRKNHQSRLAAVQQDFQKLKSQVNTQIDQFYNDLQARLKQQKQFVQTVVFKKNNQLTLRVNKLQEYTNKYFQVLKNGIQDNKQLLNNRVSGNNRSQKNEQSQEQIKQLRAVIFDIKNITQEMKVENNESNRKFDREIQQLQEKTKQTVIQLTNSLNTKIVKNSQKITDIQNTVNELTIKVNSLRASSGSQTAISADKLKKLSGQIDDVAKKARQNQLKLNQQSQKNMQQLIKIKSDITVLKSEVGALDDDIRKLSTTK